MRFYLLFILIILTFITYKVQAQQDMDLHINGTFLTGKNILKVKRDYRDPYLWVLADNNEIFRINSLTRDIVDFTGQFTAYNNYKFIDIAGVSNDTVFVATNSTDVIMYKKGAFEVLGTAQGFSGNIKSIGLNAVYESGDNGQLLGSTHLMITTTTSTIIYNYSSKNTTSNFAFNRSQLFEATYRNTINASANVRFPSDTLDQIGLVTRGYHTVFESDLYFNSTTFGNSLKSAYSTYGNAQGYSYDSFTHMSLNLWATEKGLFQMRWALNQYDVYGFKRYLAGEDITKITSIFGLTSFEPYSLMRENILVGTANGLYFSNSKLGQFNNPLYTFSHCSELGNRRVNDVCVNADSYNHITNNSYWRFVYTDICEDGIWVATTTGLYLLKPDYMAYIQPTDKINAASFVDKPGVAELKTCVGENFEISVYVSQYQSLNFQWYKNGQALTGQSNVKITTTGEGEYYAVLYDACSAVRVETNRLKLTYVPPPIFQFNYPNEIYACQGGSVTLQTSDDKDYKYRWRKDGILTGDKTFALNITKSGSYKVEVSSCSGTWVSSKTVKVTFLNVPKPDITADKVAYCPGESAKLSTGFVNDGSYTIEWFFNGALLNSEHNKTTITTTQEGNYAIKLTSNLTACDNSSANFNLKFINITQPVVAVNKSTFCVGEVAILSTSFVNDGSYLIDWLRDGVVLNAERNKTSINTTIAGKYTVKVSSNLGGCSNGSVPYTLVFENLPTITLEKIIKTTFCDGQSIDIKATYSGGNVKWANGAVTDNITIQQSGVYNATVKNASGCEVSQSINVQFNANPTLQMADVTICDLRNESVKLTAPPQFVKYEWNGQIGNNTFTTKTVGSVTLKVTDINGCTATQVINVSSECKNVYVPNTFTPNNDGYNDTWKIEGLDLQPNAMIRVFNRSGETIYNSMGYATQWDGTFKGNKLPSGTYYYIINLKTTGQTLSGSVTVIY